jgi:cyanophycinase
MVVDNSRFEVIGSGAVTVIDANAMTYSNLAGLRNNDDLALCGVTLHILPAGYRFDLNNRTPVLREKSSKADRTGS